MAKLIVFLLSFICNANVFAMCFVDDDKFCRSNSVSYQKPATEKPNLVQKDRSQKSSTTSLDTATSNAIQTCLPVSYHSIMSKIIKGESSNYAYSIGVNSKKIKLARQPSNKNEAIEWAKSLINAGYSIDMGYAQINSQHLAKKGFLTALGIGVDDIFDTCTNVLAGAKIYADAHNQNNGDVVKALSVYNTGNTVSGIQNGYVSRILSIK